MPRVLPHPGLQGRFDGADEEEREEVEEHLDKMGVLRETLTEVIFSNAERNPATPEEKARQKAYLARLKQYPP